MTEWTDCSKCGGRMPIKRKDINSTEPRICDKCIKRGDKPDKFSLNIEKVKRILVAQGYYNVYKNRIEKLQTDRKLRSRYKNLVTMEILAQLEFDRLGWKLETQYKDTRFNYRYDFYIPQFKLAIEIDEESHNSPKQKEKDRVKDENVGKNYMLRIPEIILKADVQNLSKIVVEKILMQKNYEIYDTMLQKCEQVGINKGMLYRRR